MHNQIMKTREIKELHTKTVPELRTMLKEAKGALTMSRLELAQRKLTNTTGLTNLRHDIARLETVLRSKLVEEGGNT
jgi:ribosomal protein L29